MALFITGASSGIGREIAYAYAEQGITLFLCGRNEQRLNETAEKCRTLGADVYTYLFDVTDKDSAEKAVQQADSICPLDLVIANAGVSAGVLGMDETPVSTRSIFETNIFGVINTILPASELMKTRKQGHLVIISSLSGYRGMASCPAYSASKSCVKAWGEAMRLSLKEKHIKVSVVCPGFVRSRITDKNNCPMPFFMEAPDAAEIIAKGIEKNK